MKEWTAGVDSKHWKQIETKACYATQCCTPFFQQSLCLSAMLLPVQLNTGEISIWQSRLNILGKYLMSIQYDMWYCDRA